MRIEDIHILGQPVAQIGIADRHDLAGFVVQCTGTEDDKVGIFAFTCGDGALEELGLHKVVSIKEVEPCARGGSKPCLPGWALAWSLLFENADAAIFLGRLLEDISCGICRNG
jgi:hypothetical protein